MPWRVRTDRITRKFRGRLGGGKICLGPTKSYRSLRDGFRSDIFQAFHAWLPSLQSLRDIPLLLCRLFIPLLDVLVDR